jgi:hypothetical protein
MATLSAKLSLALSLSLDAYFLLSDMRGSNQLSCFSLDVSETLCIPSSSSSSSSSSCFGQQKACSFDRCSPARLGGCSATISISLWRASHICGAALAPEAEGRVIMNSLFSIEWRGMLYTCFTPAGWPDRGVSGISRGEQPFTRKMSAPSFYAACRCARCKMPS